MRAIQISETGGPEVLRLVEQPMPQLKPGQVLVKTHAIGVAFPDMLVRSGRYPWMPPLPYVPGNEVTGHIADANASTRLGKGQPVFFTSWDMGFAGGLYAEYVAVKDTAPWPLPDHVDLDEAAAIFNYIVASLLMEHGARGRAACSTPSTTRPRTWSIRCCGSRTAAVSTSSTTTSRAIPSSTT